MNRATLTPKPGDDATVQKTTDATSAAQARLQHLRDSIDNLDAALVHLLAERFKCTQEVGRLKATNQWPAADPARETRQIARLRDLAERARLDPKFAEKFLRFIIEEVIRHHKKMTSRRDPRRDVACLSIEDQEGVAAADDSK